MQLKELEAEEVRMLRRMTGKGLSTRALLGGDAGGDRKSKGKVGKDLTNEQIEKTYGLKDLPVAQRARINQLIELLSAIRTCNKAKNLDEAIATVVESTCRILHCDRATLFMVSSNYWSVAVWSIVLAESEEI